MRPYCVRIRIIATFMMIYTSIAFSQAQQKTPPPNPYRQTDQVMTAMPAAAGNSVQEVATYIHDHFSKEAEQVRAVFFWVTKNIDYDVANMFAINFYENSDDKLKKVLASRKGICEHFALLFTSICKQLNIEAYTIEGYTKQNGFTDYIPHAWCAARIDGSWYLFDPTWGSGYISNKQFVKKLNNDYYLVSPGKLIRSHMPFDYLWQFLNYPVTTAQFYENKAVQNQGQPYFNYPDSIRAYNRAGLEDQLRGTIYRIEKNGVGNAMVFDRLHHVKLQLENLRIKEQNEKQQAAVDSLNQITDDYNNAIILINQYIDYRNHQFTPAKPDEAIKEMFDGATRIFTGITERLSKVDASFSNVASAKASLQKSMRSLEPQLKEQKDWLDEYLSKSKSKRKAMFYERKLTWFGIPLN
ncbi:transglutaminase domain-containing protein [Niabella sp.]|uniref:transglutaminase domain-containing protein n=1 Tax=Niabella sp. TaxID=1962976 RepID=UPI00261E5BED|nr:transglutaminase domain-containing protein [Niabella sp.]